MKNWLAASLLVLAPLVAIAAESPPEWAYPAAPAGFQPPPDNGQPKHVAGSTKTFTEKDVNNIHNPPDWFHHLVSVCAHTRKRSPKNS